MLRVRKQSLKTGCSICGFVVLASLLVVYHYDEFHRLHKPSQTNPTVLTSRSFSLASMSPFWQNFSALNNDLEPRSLLIFRGNHQGLGNNIMAFISSLFLSVLMKRSFRFVWNKGGQLIDISEIVSLSPDPIPRLDANFNFSHGTEWDLGFRNCPLSSSPSFLSSFFLFFEGF